MVTPDMSNPLDRETGGGCSRRGSFADRQQLQDDPPRPRSSGTAHHDSCRDSISLKTSLSTCEDTCPAALPILLRCVCGQDRPADEFVQEELRGNLRALQIDDTEVTALFMELSAHLVSIDSEETIFFVSFKTFEDIWKFTTYYTTGLLSLSLENILMEQKFWLSSLEDGISLHVSVQEDTLSLMYRGMLLQDGSFFASCSTNQMFDSSTSGGDLYLEQGDIAQFEPPFLGSGWTVLCLSDGSRGTAPHPAVEPVVPFHQWFLRSAAESVLVGDGKSSCDFPLQFAVGTCEVTQEYDAEGPDELSVAPGDRIIIAGLLVSCFDWFMGKKEATGEVGLVRTRVVKPSEDVHDSADLLLDGEGGTFFTLNEDKVIEETSALLKRRSRDDVGLRYKLDTLDDLDSEENTSIQSSLNDNPAPTDLRRNIQRILEPLAPDSRVVTMDRSLEDMPLPEEEGLKKPSVPCFTVPLVVKGSNHTESFVLLFSFLDGQDYRAEVGALYGLSSEVLVSSTFLGHSDEDELVSFLSTARETARKKKLFWVQTRLCFLLGKLCAGRSKFSQARVYLEEALSVPREGFTDLQLLGNLYSNLAAIYLLQNNPQSFFSVMERLVALLSGHPGCWRSLQDDSALKFMLRKAVLAHNTKAEARAALLLAKHHWARSEWVQVVPYLERLLVLGPWSISPSHGYLVLGRLYSKLGLHQLSISSAKRACYQPSARLSDCLSSMQLALENISRLRETKSQDHQTITSQLAPYLHQALASSRLLRPGSEQLRVLVHQLTVCLCQLFCKHQMVQQAISYVHTLISNQQLSTSAPERSSTLMWLAWLHINSNQPEAALEILDLLLDSMPEHCTAPQEGAILNMRGVALRCTGDLEGAAESYEAAVDVCQEYEDLANWAVAQANLGLLSLRGGVKHLAQTHLMEAVQLFSELQDEDHEENFIAVLLELGHIYIKQQLMDPGKGCYEWALLLAIKANLLDCQLAATSKLIDLYSSESPDQLQSLIYNQHLVHLLRRSGARAQEGGALESVSRLCLSLGTQRAYQAALDFTKSSLGIFIDLGCRKKEAFGWLRAGNIYHLLGQTELVDMYIQAAQDVALTTGDPKFLLELLEAAGDIFFNSSLDRNKAIPFYRDWALPMAAGSSSVACQLRLCNKLTELMLALKMFEEALEFAQTALDISITLGDRLNQRVAYHRLAVLYHSLDQFELAEHHYLKTLMLCPTLLLFDEETLYYVRVYQTLGDIIFYDLKDPFDAAAYYQLALAAAMDLGNKRSQLQLCTRLATIYHNFLVDRELSLFFYQRARAFAAELNIRRVNISADPTLNRSSIFRTVAQ